MDHVVTSFTSTFISGQRSSWSKKNCRNVEETIAAQFVHATGSDGALKNYHCFHLETQNLALAAFLLAGLILLQNWWCCTATTLLLADTLKCRHRRSLEQPIKFGTSTQSKEAFLLKKFAVKQLSTNTISSLMFHHMLEDWPFLASLFIAWVQEAMADRWTCTDQRCLWIFQNCCIFLRLTLEMLGFVIYEQNNSYWVLMNRYQCAYVQRDTSTNSTLIRKEPVVASPSNQVCKFWAGRSQGDGLPTLHNSPCCTMGYHTWRNGRH